MQATSITTARVTAGRCEAALAMRACSVIHAGPSTWSTRSRIPITRSYASRPNNRVSKERYNFNTSLNSTADPDIDHASHRRVTAKDLVHRTEPPVKVKMLVRDFIHDSLYNPNYGYFSRNVTIFTPPDEGYNFNSLSDTAHLQETVAERYEREYGNVEVAAAEAGRDQGGLGRQVWHTPTELFKPYYARALVDAILANYKLNHFPLQDLLLYEVGAGNGSFMIDSLKYLRDEHPEVFERTKYRIIEISSALAQIQKGRAEKEGFGDKVEVINEDIFKWEGVGGRAMLDPCYVVALEVFDNFSHDMIRHDIVTLQPFQGIVSIDETGDFSLLYEPVTDPLLRRVLAYRRYLPLTPSTSPPLPAPLLASPLLRKLYAAMPFAPNLSPPDFVPSKAVHFLEGLREKLPAHRLLVADFDSLPEAVQGRNGPVVQTRYGGSMVPCETFLVKQGYFDIFFPTDFELLRDTYAHIMNSPPTSASSNSVAPTTNASSQSPASPKRRTTGASTPDASSPAPSSSAPSTPLDPGFFLSTGVRGFRRRQVGIYSHAEFLETFAEPETIRRTRLRDGTSAMLTMYKNAKMMF